MSTGNLHVLKCWPHPFDAVWHGEKTHEIRKTDDRSFALGDRLLMREYDPHKPLPHASAGMGDTTRDESARYSGRWILVRVAHITHGTEFGLPQDLCVMSITIVDKGGHKPSVGTHA